MTRAIRRFLLGRCRGPGLPDRRESDLTHYVKSLKNLISSQRRGVGGDLLRVDSCADFRARQNTSLVSIVLPTWVQCHAGYAEKDVIFMTLARGVHDFFFT